MLLSPLQLAFHDYGLQPPTYVGRARLAMYDGGTSRMRFRRKERCSVRPNTGTGIGVSNCFRYKVGTGRTLTVDETMTMPWKFQPVKQMFGWLRQRSTLWTPFISKVRQLEDGYRPEFWKAERGLAATKVDAENFGGWLRNGTVWHQFGPSRLFHLLAPHWLA